MSDNSSAPAPTPTGRAAPTDPAKTKQPNPVIPEDVLTAILAQQGVPASKAGVVVQQITTEVTQRMHSGPLPAVEDFKGYDEICPGAARDIVDMAVRQQKHYHWVEKADVIGSMLLPILGLFAAVLVIAAMLFSGAYLAMHGHENLAVAVLSGTGIATIAGAFLQNRRSKPNNGASPPQTKNQNKKKKK